MEPLERWEGCSQRTYEYTQGEIFRWQDLLPTRSWRDRNTQKFHSHVSKATDNFLRTKTKFFTADQELNAQPETKPENSDSPVKPQ